MRQEDFPFRLEASEPSARRVEEIVERVRRRTVARDLLDFGAGKVWVAAAEVVGLALAKLGGTRDRQANRNVTEPAAQNRDDLSVEGGP